MADMDQLLTKKVADRYLKREVLGEGTYGVVYKAIDTKVPSIPTPLLRRARQFYPANFRNYRLIIVLGFCGV